MLCCAVAADGCDCGAGTKEAQHLEVRGNGRTAYNDLMKILRFIVLAALMLGFAQAGSRYEVKCSDDKCGFTSSIGIGGGFKFEQASGWCQKCDTMVSVTWKRGDKKEPAVLEAWDALAGMMRKIFKCPKCGTPFMQVDHIDELKHCPKCGKPSLKSRRTQLYD